MATAYNYLELWVWFIVTNRLLEAKTKTNSLIHIRIDGNFDVSLFCVGVYMYVVCMSVLWSACMWCVYTSEYIRAGPEEPVSPLCHCSSPSFLETGSCTEPGIRWAPASPSDTPISAWHSPGVTDAHTQVSVWFWGFKLRSLYLLAKDSPVP